MTNILFATWFFFIAVISPNLHVAKPLSMVSVLFFVLYAGFIITKTDIPDYLIWIYWLDPIAWALRALSINQYMASEFQVCTYRGVDYCKTNNGKMMGVVQLKQFGMPTGKEWIWYCVIYLVALYVIFVAMSFATLEYIRFENGHGIALSEEQSKDQDEDDGKSYTKMPATPAGSQASDSVIVPVQEFVPVTLAFKDLHYFVPNPTKGEPDLELLKGVSGYALPGTVTALMGSSGADLGRKSAHLMEYFMRIPGTPEMAPGYNPATWMLEVIGAGVETKVTNTTDYVQVFQNSEEYKQLQAALAVHTVPRADVPEMSYTSKRAATNAIQCQYVVQRFMRMYWRTPSYNYTRILLSAFLAILFGITYLSFDYTTYSGVNGGVGMVFMTTLFIGIISFNSVLPLSAEERASYYRERASQTYNALWYWVGSTVAEVPYVFVSTFVFTIIYYPFVGFKGNVGDVIVYGLELSLFVLMNVYFGQLMAYAMPRVDVAASMGVLLNSIFFLFMGFNPPESQIPSGYRWLTTITPPKYSLSILVAQIFAKCENGEGMGCHTMSKVPPVILTELGKENVTVKEFTEFLFNMKYDNTVKYTWVVLAIIVLFRLLGLLSLRYINHQKR
ncbi:unnamed protein product [Aphanomyces euteiches]